MNKISRNRIVILLENQEKLFYELAKIKDEEEEFLFNTSGGLYSFTETALEHLESAYDSMKDIMEYLENAMN